MTDVIDPNQTDHQPLGLTAADYDFIDLVYDDPDGIPAELQNCAQELGITQNLPLGRVSIIAAMNRHPSNFRGVEIPESAVEVLERRNYAYEAPSFADQCLDKTRTTDFSFSERAFGSDTEGAESNSTEIEGLRDLRRFLEKTIHNLESRDPSNDPGINQKIATAKSLLEGLTFIGDPEYRRGASMLGAYWKKFLDADPRNRLCVITGISDSDKYPGTTKSDKHLLGSVEEEYGFSQPESAYAGRVTNGLDDLGGVDPAHIKIVILDDWALSGGQVSRVHESLMKHPLYKKLRHQIECNFIVAQGDRINGGMVVEVPSRYSGRPRQVRLPVRAAYKARRSLIPQPESGNTHITGLHSSANFGFSTVVDELFRTQRQNNGVKHPGLAAIITRYRKTK